jgi:tetratricopeptide (TPR) repeat protein
MKARVVVIVLAGLAVVAVAVYERPRRAVQRPAWRPANSLTARPLGKPRLPAPRISVQAPPVGMPADDLRPTNLLARLLKGDEPATLSLQQVEPFLQDNRRSAESLLAAFRATGDATLLREAVDKYPNDPRVNFVALFKSESPEARRHLLEAFKQSAPDNALANYLSAQDYFKSGQTDRAVEELVAASGKHDFGDYSAHLVQNLEEAYRSAGYSALEAKVAAAYDLPLPQLAELRRLGQNLAELAKLYRQAGDATSAEAAWQMGLALGERLGEPSAQNSLVHDFVGLAIQRQILETMDPASPYDSGGRTVRERLDEILSQREELKRLHDPTAGLGGGQRQDILETLSEQDLASFFDRMKVFGESEALRWARNKQGGR